MGMIGNLLRVTEAELENYLEDSSLLETRVFNDEPGTEDDKLVDIDKSWDGILFLLTGQSITSNPGHPLVKVLFSGQLIDENQDLGYGPAHYLTPSQVADLNNAISIITTADLMQKYNPGQMIASNVYPVIWDEGNDAFDYLATYFTLLQEVFAEATKNAEAIITFLN